MRESQPGGLRPRDPSQGGSTRLDNRQCAARADREQLRPVSDERMGAVERMGSDESFRFQSFYFGGTSSTSVERRPAARVLSEMGRGRGVNEWVASTGRAGPPPHLLLGFCSFSIGATAPVDLPA